MPKKFVNGKLRKRGDICRYCNHPFEKEADWQKYCDKECSDAQKTFDSIIEYENN